jgi:hypothetical protein
MMDACLYERGEPESEIDRNAHKMRLARPYASFGRVMCVFVCVSACIYPYACMHAHAHHVPAAF